LPVSNAETTHECVELWLARDEQWRCVVCEPAHFPSEILERKTMQQLLRLFDSEQWSKAA
jgi:hypothetical protein